MKKDEQRDNDLQDMIRLVIQYRNDRDFMDEISKTTFPFTTKYLTYQDNKKGYGMD